MVATASARSVAVSCWALTSASGTARLRPRTATERMITRLIYLLLFVSPQVLLYLYLRERLPDPTRPERARLVRTALAAVFTSFNLPWAFVVGRVLFGSVWGVGRIPYLGPWIAWQLLGWIFCSLLSVYIVGRTVLQTGDMIDISRAYIPAYVRAFRELHAPLGVVTVLGNHDRYTGEQEVIRGCRDAGQVFLQNDCHLVERGGATLALLGIDDPHNWTADDPQPEDVAAALAAAPSHAFQVLLAHRPGAWDTAAPRGIPLTLAGHIHGGQFYLPGIGWSAGRLITKYVMGHFQRGNSQLYVSRGIGVVVGAREATAYFCRGAGPPRPHARAAAIASQAASSVSATPAWFSGHSLAVTRSITSVTTPSHTAAHTSAAPGLTEPSAFPCAIRLSSPSRKSRPTFPLSSSSRSPCRCRKNSCATAGSRPAPATSPRPSSASFSRGPTLSASASFTSRTAQRPAARYSSFRRCCFEAKCR